MKVFKTIPSNIHPDYILSLEGSYLQAKVIIGERREKEIMHRSYRILSSMYVHMHAYAHTFNSNSGYPGNVKSMSRSSIVPPPSRVRDSIPTARAFPVLRNNDCM